MQVSISLQPGDPCPCGSRLPVSHCCWFIDRLVRMPARITVPGPQTGFSHPKCYARSLRDCSQTISGEDYISFNILEQIGGPLRVTGLTWTDGEVKTLPLRALRANVLCTRHNSALSPLDARAGQLFRWLINIEDLVRKRTDARMVRLINGHDIERWLLKVLCGVAEAGIADHQAGPEGVRNLAKWLDVLFHNNRFPNRHGLYVNAAIGARAVAENGVKFSLVSTHADLYGLTMQMRDKTFTLALRSPDPISTGSILAEALYRPSQFLATADGAIKASLQFTWLGQHDQRGIVWDYDDGTVSAAPVQLPGPQVGA